VRVGLVFDAHGTVRDFLLFWPAGISAFSFIFGDPSTPTTACCLMGRNRFRWRVSRRPFFFQRPFADAVSRFEEDRVLLRYSSCCLLKVALESGLPGVGSTKEGVAVSFRSIPLPPQRMSPPSSKASLPRSEA